MRLESTYALRRRNNLTGGTESRAAGQSMHDQRGRPRVGTRIAPPHWTTPPHAIGAQRRQALTRRAAISPSYRSLSDRTWVDHRRATKQLRCHRRVIARGVFVPSVRTDKSRENPERFGGD